VSEPIPGRWVRLVPVEVFGTECDEHEVPIPFIWGLCDAVPAWSDCNRSSQSIFRLDDLPDRHDKENITVQVWVSDAELPKLTRNWSTT
jgi:hypothetical protein